MGEADVGEEKDDNIFGDTQWPFSELQIIFKSPTILCHFHIYLCKKKKSMKIYEG